MTFLNKVTFLAGMLVSSTFLAYPMNGSQFAEQTRVFDSICQIISIKPTTQQQEAEQEAAFFDRLRQLSIESIRDYRVGDSGNSLLHLAALYGKPKFVRELLAYDFFNLFEGNLLLHTPIQFAIRKIEIQSVTHNPNLDDIVANLEIIEMLASKETSFQDDHFSYVLFLLIKCLSHNYSDNLAEIINRFYVKNYEHISIDVGFPRITSTSFDLVVDNGFAYILLIFLRTQNIDANVLNPHLEDLFMIASQNSGTSLLDEIFAQAHLDRQLLCNLIHDRERGISDETRTRIISFIRANCAHLLATPGAAVGVGPDGAPELRPVRRTKSIDPHTLGRVRKLGWTDTQ